MICVLFDLDGTLTDSAEGIKNPLSMHWKRKGYRYPVMIS